MRGPRWKSVDHSPIFRGLFRAHDPRVPRWRACPHPCPADASAKQNHAREHIIPIDDICFNFEMMSKLTLRKKPKDGVYITGLFIEAATWDYEQKLLVENDIGVLTSLAPTIWLKPTTKDKEGRFPYNCPVYKTSDRRGELSTTGHSTNFVMKIRIPTEKSQLHWKQRGVAMLTQEDF